MSYIIEIIIVIICIFGPLLMLIGSVLCAAISISLVLAGIMTIGNLLLACIAERKVAGNLKKNLYSLCMGTFVALIVIGIGIVIGYFGFVYCLYPVIEFLAYGIASGK
jgi:hypothetical protein